MNNVFFFKVMDLRTEQDLAFWKSEADDRNAKEMRDAVEEAKKKAEEYDRELEAKKANAQYVRNQRLSALSKKTS